jgi:microcompartment protein CcmK/EutM
MIIGNVIGDVYSTINHPFYDGKKLLMVETTSFSGKPDGDYVIAVDCAQAGVGDQVLILDEGTGARQVVNDPTAPLRAVIVGVVDHVEIGA